MTKTKHTLTQLKKDYDYVSSTLDLPENKKLMEMEGDDFTDVEVVKLTETVKSGELEKYWNSKGYEFIKNDHIYLAEYGKTMTEESYNWIIAPSTTFRGGDGVACRLYAGRYSDGRRKLLVVYGRGDWGGGDGWGFMLRKSKTLSATTDTLALKTLDSKYELFLEWAVVNLEGINKDMREQLIKKVKELLG